MWQKALRPFVNARVVAYISFESFDICVWTEIIKSVETLFMFATLYCTIFMSLWATNWLCVLKSNA